MTPPAKGPRESGAPREGFTTGSAVAAAAKAAVILLLGGSVGKEISVPLPCDENGLPREKRLVIPLHATRLENGESAASVIKDGGDDPDATHRMEFIVEAAKEPFESAFPTLALTERITLYNGGGIGIATLPGLPVARGEIAINPGPRNQIAVALAEAAGEFAFCGPIHCRITAPEGEARARHTLNARLGVIGGISILGTDGTVKPFSSIAWQETIRQALNVAHAAGNSAVALTTGRRSEKALQRHLPHFAEQAFIQVADYAAFSIRETTQRGFTSIAWGCFPGKLVKLAQGEGWTHARASSPDFGLLETLCRASGVPAPITKAAVMLPTVLGALELVHEYSPRKHAAVVRLLAKQAVASLKKMTGGGHTPSITLYAFDMQGRLLAKGYA